MPLEILADGGDSWLTTLFTAAVGITTLVVAAWVRLEIMVGRQNERLTSNSKAIEELKEDAKASLSSRIELAAECRANRDALRALARRLDSSKHGRNGPHSD